MVCPLNEGTLKKNDTLNFRLISFLTTFSKIYKRVTKKLIDTAINKYLSPLNSVYRQNYSTQYVFIRSFEEWRKGLDNNFVVGGILMDLPKAFDCIFHNLLIAKLETVRFDGYQCIPFTHI